MEMEDGKFGVVEYWSGGVLKCWSIGSLKSTGLYESQTFSLFPESCLPILTQIL